MSAVTTAPETTTVRGTSAVRVARAGGILFLALVATLHALKPELDPSWRMVSEYQIGRHGWLMQVAFLALATSCVAAYLSLRRTLRTRMARTGGVFLLVAAVGIVIAGIFATDPITATKAELTTHGNLHGLGTMLGIPGFAIAAPLVYRGLRGRAGVAEHLTHLRLATHFVWVSLAVFITSMAVQFEGTFGPDVAIGWPNRLLVAAYAGWLVTAARTAERLQAQ